MSWIRKALAVLAGVVASGCLIALAEMLAHGRTSGDGPFIGAVIGYALGAIVGTGVASMIASGPVARLVPLLLGVLALINVLSFPHPMWFIPASAFALIAGWVLGGRIAAIGKGRGKSAESRA
jgi:hypothetical protein